MKVGLHANVVDDDTKALADALCPLFKTLSQGEIMVAPLSTCGLTWNDWNIWRKLMEVLAIRFGSKSAFPDVPTLDFPSIQIISI